MTPLGRIVSSDVEIMDNNLADSMRMLFITLSYAFAVFILITAYFYYFAMALVPFYLFYRGATS
jgi:ATP-binding cassette subfamily C (CFTR/MRP) protein 1